LRYAGEVFENFCFVVVLSGFYIFEWYFILNANELCKWDAENMCLLR
jgi:hypothetical protein